MKELLALCAVVAVSLTGSLVAQPRRDAAPWQWTNEERIRARLDHDKRTERLSAEKRARALRQQRQVIVEAPTVPEYADVIDGHRTPELFFPQQLFGSLLTHAYVGFDSDYRHEYRQYHSARATALGLPGDFWQQVAVIAAPAIDDLRRQHQFLASQGSADADLTPTSNDTTSSQMAKSVCRSRTTAYDELRQRYGESFDRFLYEVIAPGARTTYRVAPSREELRAQAGDCQ